MSLFNRKGDNAQPAARSITRATHIFGLIVAIDQYPDPVLPNLSGCINDAENIHEFLLSTSSVPPGGILVLRNEEATRDAIIAAFNSHFIHNKNIAYGDAMVFFFGGHCYQMHLPNSGGGTDVQVLSAIVPYNNDNQCNATLLHQDHGSLNMSMIGIPSTTIDALMRRIAIERGDNLVCTSQILVTCL